MKMFDYEMVYISQYDQRGHLFKTGLISIKCKCWKVDFSIWSYTIEF